MGFEYHVVSIRNPRVTIMAKNSALEDYLAKTPADRHAVIRQFDALSRRTVPALKPCITHGLLGYGPYHYQSGISRLAFGRRPSSAILRSITAPNQARRAFSFLRATF